MRRRWSFLVVSAAALGLLAAGAPVPVLAAPGGIDCLAASPASCYTPQQFRTAYDIQPLLDRGIDGRGETVSMIVYAADPATPPPQVTDIRQPIDGSLVASLSSESSPLWPANAEVLKELRGTTSGTTARPWARSARADRMNSPGESQR